MGHLRLFLIYIRPLYIQCAHVCLGEAGSQWSRPEKLGLSCPWPLSSANFTRQWTEFRSKDFGAITKWIASENNDK